MSDGAFKTLFHLLQHIFIAAVLFCAIAGVAVALWYATDWMEFHKIPPHIYVTCEYVAEFLLFSDVFCLVVYVLSEVTKWLKEIVRSVRETW